MNPPSSTAAPEGFRYDPTTRTILRESDGEAMAVLTPENVLTFTHHSRERNYGTAIRSLLDAAGIPFAEPGEESSATPPPPVPAGPTELPQGPPPAAPAPAEVAIVDPVTGPERHPILGAYSREHLLWDWNNCLDKEFAAKWAGPLLLSTKRTVQAEANFFGETADHILKFLDELPPYHADNEIEARAGRMYDAYCAAVGGVAFNGDPLPNWSEFRADPDKTKQSDAWIAAAKVR